jgi:hypothetical protein
MVGLLSSPPRPERLWGKLASYPMRTGAGGGGRGEAYHYQPFNAEVKNAWSYTFTSPIHLHGVELS